MANVVSLICLLLQKKLWQPVGPKQTKENFQGWDDWPEGVTNQQWPTRHKLQ
jgi:hypothetical protein